MRPPATGYQSKQDHQAASGTVQAQNSFFRCKCSEKQGKYDQYLHGTTTEKDAAPLFVTLDSPWKEVNVQMDCQMYGKLRDSSGGLR